VSRARRRRVLVLGAGGHARAVAEVARDAGWTVAGFTDLAPDPANPLVLGRDEDVPRLVRRHRIDGVLVGIGNTALAHRAEMFHAFRTLIAPPLVHPRAVVARSASVDVGTVVFPTVVLGAGVVIGVNAVLYSGAIVEHDSRIGAHVYLSPGVVLSGGVTVEDGAFVGAGAVVIPNVRIGAGALVAAGAVVIRDVAARVTVLGVPARPRGVGVPR
jgi:sugar O-acyltransferase (sialic acid O-acetyltransferase NeuD family)